MALHGVNPNALRGRDVAEGLEPAPSRRPSIYDNPLQDISQNNSVGIEDSFIGDILGLDGQAGVQGPGMGASLEGARRRAIEIVQSKGVPVTEQNVQAVMEQLPNLNEPATAESIPPPSPITEGPIPGDGNSVGIPAEAIAALVAAAGVAGVAGARGPGTANAIAELQRLGLDPTGQPLAIAGPPPDTAAPAQRTRTSIAGPRATAPDPNAQALPPPPQTAQPDPNIVDDATRAIEQSEFDVPDPDNSNVVGDVDGRPVTANADGTFTTTAANGEPVTAKTVPALKAALKALRGAL